MRLAYAFDLLIIRSFRIHSFWLIAIEIHKSINKFDEVINRFDAKCKHRSVGFSLEKGKQTKQIVSDKQIKIIETSERCSKNTSKRKTITTKRN